MLQFEVLRILDLSSPIHFPYLLIHIHLLWFFLPEVSTHCIPLCFKTKAQSIRVMQKIRMLWMPSVFLFCSLSPLIAHILPFALKVPNIVYLINRWIVNHLVCLFFTLQFKPLACAWHEAGGDIILDLKGTINCKTDYYFIKKKNPHIFYHLTHLWNMLFPYTAFIKQ